MNIAQEISPGHRYGCHSDKLGDAPRHETGPLIVQTGRKVTIENGALVSKHIASWHQTQWNPDVGCGHDLSVSDPSCTGCVHRVGGV